MRIDRVFLLAILCLTMFPGLTPAFRLTPGTLTSAVVEVTPNRTASDEIVTATGFGLGRSMVRNVYLVDAKGSYRVEILEQTDALLRFRVPARMGPGLKSLTLEVTGAWGEATEGSKLLQQDVYLEVDPVQLRDAPLLYPALPTDFKKNSLSYRFA